MEAGMSLGDLWMRLQKASALGLDLLQHIEGGKDPIGQRLVGKWPQSGSLLHFWGIGRQEHQVDPLWELEPSTAVPASTIKDQQDVFVWPCSHFLGKSGEARGRRPPR